MSKDIIGERGEALFRVAITRWCGGEPWFEAVFLGQKAEALDFEVRLLGSSVFHAIFFVQVKATAKPNRYAGIGKQRKLLVNLTRANAKKLGAMKLPAYVVGIDVLSDASYIRNVPAGTKKGFTTISTQSPLNCRAIKRLWREVEEFWRAMPPGMTSSAF